MAREKNGFLGLRLNDETMEALDILAEELRTGRSAVARAAIAEYFGAHPIDDVRRAAYRRRCAERRAAMEKMGVGGGSTHARSTANVHSVRAPLSLIPSPKQRRGAA